MKSEVRAGSSTFQPGDHREGMTFLGQERCCILQYREYVPYRHTWKQYILTDQRI